MILETCNSIHVETEPFSIPVKELEEGATSIVGLLNIRGVDKIKSDIRS